MGLSRNTIKSTISKTTMIILGFAILLDFQPHQQIAQADGVQTAKPAVGIREQHTRTWAIRNAKIVISPGRIIEQGTLVIHDGVITAIGVKVDIPVDAQIVNLQGKTLYPGLIDAYGETSVKNPEGGVLHWNKNITPQREISDSSITTSAENKTFLKQGVVARLIAPDSGILRGTSSLYSTGSTKLESSLLKRRVAQHALLTLSGRRNRKEYPNSPMGAVALARQTMYDAVWYRNCWNAYRADQRLPRPKQNDALAVLEKDLQHQKPFIVSTTNELFFLRADRFSREFGLNLIVRGSGYEYRRLSEVISTGRSIIVPVDFPKAPDVSTPTAARDASLTRLMHWDIAPENPARLDRAGVKIALCSYGLKDKEKFLSSVRKAVARGLKPDTALRALTITPAKLFGVDQRLGTLELGKAANIVVTDGDLFQLKTKILETWVDGIRFEHTTNVEHDLRGHWKIKIPNEKGKAIQYLLKINGKPDKLSGVIALDKKEAKLAKVGYRHSQFAISFRAKSLGFKGAIRLSGVVVLDKNKQLTWNGFGVLANGTQFPIAATHEKASSKKAKPSPKKPAAKNPKDKTNNSVASKKTKQPVKALYPVNYPLGAFGKSNLPTQSEWVLLRGATIWTSGPQGIIENGSVLIHQGKIAQVGKKIDAPQGAVVVNAKGMHITPGIIDCHSHIATDSGVNESAQAVTAEVRIGDLIDSNDIAIYRQLAGGVTSSNILHGSANPIGGQNQVIKMRWGANSNQMKFKRAPAGIKFALGENVKQSNWGDNFKTRYPQSRMGVEQIVLDEFIAARDYIQNHRRFKKNRQGLPPRTDLELEAISEILQGKRWIHCHSYRQDEILALMRTCRKFGVTIGTLQHILEGYKVADTMKKQGVMGSSFSDWWAYKFEVYDAIPYNGAVMHNQGVVVSFNSDDAELGRRLNLEAAKAIKYGNVPKQEALKFVTLNPAKQLRIDQYVGSLEVDKDADLVLWSGPPMSVYSRCEQTWIDGRKYFDRKDDLQQRKEIVKMRAALIQRILTTGAEMLKPGEIDKTQKNLWPRHDTFCGHCGSEHLFLKKVKR